MQRCSGVSEHFTMFTMCENGELSKKKFGVNFLENTDGLC